MRRIEFGKGFRKDCKRMEKRGVNLKKLQSILELIASDASLPQKNRPHMLSGEWKGFQECQLYSGGRSGGDQAPTGPIALFADLLLGALDIAQLRLELLQSRFCEPNLHGPPLIRFLQTKIESFHLYVCAASSCS